MGKTAAVLCTRGEAHVSRLSLIYALLDNSPMIEREHIKAAKALWDYCCDSVEWIFTGKTADLRTIMDQLNPRVASQVKQTAERIQHAKFREKHSRCPRPLWYVEGCLRYLVKSGYVVRNEGEKGTPSWTRQGAKKNSL
jgi:DNA replicative helicase MCM subunit Mcm2 (Cdc46/Mcm family)